MGDVLMGRHASVKIGTTVISNLGSWEVTFSIDRIDVTVFGSVWKKEVPGFQGWGARLSGFYDIDDSVGQQILKAAALAATKVTDIRFYMNTTDYWTPDVTADSLAGCYVGNVVIGQDKAGVASVSFEVMGFGPLLEVNA